MIYRYTLPFPPSTNTYYRTFNGRMLISKKGRQFAKDVAAIVASHGPRPMLSVPLMVDVTLYPPDNRKRDLDNHASKSLYDSLTKAGVWIDDSQIKAMSARMMEVDKPGCAIVTVMRLDEHDVNERMPLDALSDAATE